MSDRQLKKPQPTGNCQRVAAFLYFALIAVHVWTVPYNKVEESFGVQALHDIFHTVDRFVGTAHRRTDASSNPLASQRRQPESPPPWEWDHIEYPGVVPRTFIGVGLLAGAVVCLTLPLRYAMGGSLVGGGSLFSLLASRFILGAAWWVVLVRVAAALDTLHASDEIAGRYALRTTADDHASDVNAQPGGIGTQPLHHKDTGCTTRCTTRIFPLSSYFHSSPSWSSSAGLCMWVLLLTQFHLPFYSSRLLPNSFALLTATFAFADYLITLRPSTTFLYTYPPPPPHSSPPPSDKHAPLLRQVQQHRNAGDVQFAAVRCCAVLLFTSLVFRFELLVLFSAVFVDLVMLRRKVNAFRCIATCFTVAVSSVALSLAVDSVMWRGSVYTHSTPYGLLWPESWVFFFNAIQRKSHLWGVSSWHWYFTNAIPRALNPLTLFSLVFLLLPPGGTAVKPTVPLVAKLHKEQLHQTPHPSRAFYLEIFSESLGITSPYYSSSDKIPLLGLRRYLAHCTPCLVGFLVWTAPVVVLSSTGHKELRFIFPSLLALSAFSALGLARFITFLQTHHTSSTTTTSSCKESSTRQSQVLIPAVFAIGVVSFFSFGISTVRLLSSKHNYPAAHALTSLYANISSDVASPWQQLPPSAVASPCTIYLHSSVTGLGISRFIHRDELCRVEKVELIKPEQYESRYWFVMTNQHVVPGMSSVAVHGGFHRWAVEWSNVILGLPARISSPASPFLVLILPLPRIRLEPAAHVHLNNNITHFILPDSFY